MIAMKRVVIMGQPGSGKSTLARLMGAKTGLPVVHIDHIHWMSGWVERPKPEKIAMAMAAQNRDTWIMEGGLGATKDHRIARCDTLINLEFPLWLRFIRVVRRTLTHYGKTRDDLPDGCAEYFSPEFYRWIWATRRTNRDANRRWITKAGPDVTVHVLRSPRDVRRFLDTL